MSRAPQVKNRAPAPIQITAEQLLREAKERDLETVSRAPKQYIADNEELQLYRQGKRKDYENQIRRQRHLIGVWCKYALWEASQKEFVRARSVFERALDVDYRSQTIWFKYAEMEMKNKFINHARHIWDRAVSLLPRVDTFWYKYSYMEEMVGAIDEARQVFERWMKWMPDDMGWAAYIKFEMRQGSVKRALPTCRAYLKYARWEEHNKASAQVQASESEADEAELREIKTEFTAFEKRHGDKAGIEDVILNNRREHYNELLKADPFHYDTWFDLCRLEEAELEGTAEGSPEHSQALERCRDTYERAIANVPPLAEKRYWRRYIYLWIGYALLEELHGPPSLSDPLKDDSSDSGLAAGGLPSGIDRARDVYRACLQLIPHKKFTFGKLWLFAAQLEVRARDLGAARKLLGRAIGMCGKENIFKGYIELELQLGEVERCRAIY
ncbi:Crnkl1, partial [Symbiodinium microadriaticum]